MAQEKSQFTSDRRITSETRWGGRADWDAGTAEYVDTTTDRLVARPPIEVGEMPESAIWRVRAADLALSDGQEVSTWSDAIGSNDLVAQGTEPPIYREDVVNGYPGVEFIPSRNDEMHAAGLTASSSTAYIYVVDFNTKDTSTHRYFTDGINERQICAQIDNARTHRGIGMWAESNGWQRSSAYSSSPSVITYNFSANEIKLNGSVIVSGDPGSGSLDGLKLGPGSTDGVAVDLTLLDSPTASEVAEAESLVSNKYGIAI
jgi:hypothetical protein